MCSIAYNVKVHLIRMHDNCATQSRFDIKVQSVLNTNHSMRKEVFEYTVHENIFYVQPKLRI